MSDLLFEKIKQDPSYLSSIKDPHHDLLIKALAFNGSYLAYVDENLQFFHVCITAIKQDPLAIQYVVNPNNSLFFEAVARNPLAFFFLEEKHLSSCYINHIYDIAIRTTLNLKRKMFKKMLDVYSDPQSTHFFQEKQAKVFDFLIDKNHPKSNHDFTFFAKKAIREKRDEIDFNTLILEKIIEHRQYLISQQNKGYYYE